MKIDECELSNLTQEGILEVIQEAWGYLGHDGQVKFLQNNNLVGENDIEDLW